MLRSLYFGGHLAAAAILLAAPVIGWAQMRQRDPAAAFEQADADKDGKVTQAEYAAARSRHFAQLDHNGDGVVSRADFPRASSRPQIAARLDAMIAEADLNKDGQVTREELAKAPMPMFTRADTNKDGAVTQAEIAALRAAHGR